MRFTKPPKTFDEQLDILRVRGMDVEDPVRTCHYLQHINYYRLTGYWLPFEADHATHRFRRGTRFSDVLNLYIFDRELRLLLLDAIERIEVSLRTQWAYHMAHRYGPHAHLDPALATRKSWHANNLESLKKELERSDELFVQHYRNTYTQPISPPIWSVSEVMSLGLLSRWFTQLRTRDRGTIAKTYQLDQKVYQAFIRHLTYIRNLSAHHCRVWNRSFTVTMELPRHKPPGLAQNFNPAEDRKLYNTLVMIAYLMDCVSPGHLWKQRLKELIERYTIDPLPMGFPQGFALRPIWADTWGKGS